MITERRIGPVRERDRLAEARADEKIQTVIQNGKAARTVADHSDNADDCQRLLEMLGLEALEGKRS
ncbi:MAG: hypothetical protein ABIQ18_42690 [Umezawaea sp.]